MLLGYLNAAMEKAHYEMIEDEEPYYGEIPGLEGLWATGPTLEGCRHSLMEALEDWVFFSSRQAGISREDWFSTQ
jgi:predicted RNase H-like HicB family nuclease